MTDCEGEKIVCGTVDGATRTEIDIFFQGFSSLPRVLGLVIQGFLFFAPLSDAEFQRSMDSVTSINRQLPWIQQQVSKSNDQVIAGATEQKLGYPRVNKDMGPLLCHLLELRDLLRSTRFSCFFADQLLLEHGLSLVNSQQLSVSGSVTVSQYNNNNQDSDDDEDYPSVTSDESFCIIPGQLLYLDPSITAMIPGILSVYYVPCGVGITMLCHVLNEFCFVGQKTSLHQQQRPKFDPRDYMLRVTNGTPQGLSTDWNHRYIPFCSPHTHSWELVQRKKHFAPPPIPAREKPAKPKSSCIIT
jgi:hypothetical protein